MIFQSDPSAPNIFWDGVESPERWGCPIRDFRCMEHVWAVYIFLYPWGFWSCSIGDLYGFITFSLIIDNYDVARGSK